VRRLELPWELAEQRREWTIELQFNADYPSRAKRASTLLLMFSSHKQRHVNAHLTLKMKIICMHTSSSPGQCKMLIPDTKIK
jgi:hypothetical protein